MFQQVNRILEVLTLIPFFLLFYAFLIYSSLSSIFCLFLYSFLKILIQSSLTLSLTLFLGLQSLRTLFKELDELVETKLWSAMRHILRRALEMCSGRDSDEGAPAVVSTLRIIEREERYTVIQQHKYSTFIIKKTISEKISLNSSSFSRLVSDAEVFQKIHVFFSVPWCTKIRF